VKAFRFCSTILAAGLLASGVASATTVFTNIPGTLPSSFASSLGYEANSVGEFGGILQPDLTGGTLLTSVTVVLQNFATQRVYDPENASPAGYAVPLTLTLFNVNADGTVGSSFATQTVDPTIAWASAANCNVDGAPTACDVQAVNFGFAGQNLPSEFIWGLAFPTNFSTGGTVPVPSNSLNLALTLGPNGVFIPATVGTDLYQSCSSGLPGTEPSTNYCRTVFADPNDLGAGFGQVQVFFGGSGIVEFDAALASSTPEPATLGLIGLGLAGLVFVARKKSRS
jgi:hypothetical protein